MPNFDRTATRKTTLHHDQDADDAAYWQTRSVEERMESLEFLRQQAYSFYFLGNGTGKPTYTGIQRVGRVIRMKKKC